MVCNLGFLVRGDSNVAGRLGQTLVASVAIIGPRRYLFICLCLVLPSRAINVIIHSRRGSEGLRHRRRLGGKFFPPLSGFLLNLPEQSAVPPVLRGLGRLRVALPLRDSSFLPRYRRHRSVRCRGLDPLSIIVDLARVLAAASERRDRRDRGLKLRLLPLHPLVVRLRVLLVLSRHLVVH